VTVTPTMQKNMKTRVHHAKLGKPPWIADIMELTKAMIHASCSHNVSQQRTCRTTPVPTHNTNRYRGQRKGISDDAAQAEARRSLAVASVFHFA